MADPRFYRNHGPFDLATLCAKAGVEAPGSADAAIMVRDLAGLAGAGPEQLAFYSGVGDFKDAFSQSKAGICLVPRKAPEKLPPPPAGTVLVPCGSVSHAWAAIAAFFYPDDELGFFAQERDVHETARLGDGVALGRGVTIGPRAEIGAGTRIGAGAVIGQGVAIGRNCEIGANAVITHTYMGDEVKVLAGAVVGQSGFGFVSSANGHVRIPQLGRVIVQDRVEVGACTAIDRGALGDTVIGEGTKIDNLVHIAHNVQIGRHCLLTAQVAIAGSSEIGDFVIMGGQSGVGDHVYVGPNSRLAPRTGVITGQRLAGGQDYGGIPAKPLKEYFREIHMVSRLVARRKRETHD